MTNLSSAELPQLVVLIAIAAAVAWYDVRWRRIPNMLCLATLVAGLVASALSGGLAVLPSHGFHLLLALLGGAALFAVRAIGGGDAKFYAAVAGWFPLGKAALLLTSVALAGLALLIVWFGYRRLAGRPIRSAGGGPFDALPYGVAIGCGAVLAFATSA